MAGFEPLLKFAYTSKLHFKKDDVVDIRNSASILGFRDLDEACFDFLLPKFFSSSAGSAVRKTCCKKKCKRRLSEDELGNMSDDVMSDEKEVKPVADSSSQQEVAWLCNKSANSKMESNSSAGNITPVVEGTSDYWMQCPKYRRQLACGKKICEKSRSSPVTLIRDDCDLSSSSYSSTASSKNESETEHRGSSTSNTTRQSSGGGVDPWRSEIHDREVSVIKKEVQERQEKCSGKGRVTDIEEGFSDESSTKPASLGSSVALGEGSRLILHHCHLKTFGPAGDGLVGHEEFERDIKEDKKIRSNGVLAPLSIHQMAEVELEQKRAHDETDSGWLETRQQGHPASMEGAREAEERSAAERDVAEHPAKRLGSDVGYPQLSFPDPDTGSGSDTGSGKAQSKSLEWLNYCVNLSSKRSGCPFLPDQDRSKCLWKGAELYECEGTSQSGVSSLNSGEDGDSGTETEGDSEAYTRERARQVRRVIS